MNIDKVKIAIYKKYSSEQAKVKLNASSDEIVNAIELEF